MISNGVVLLMRSWGLGFGDVIVRGDCCLVRCSRVRRDMDSVCLLSVVAEGLVVSKVPVFLTGCRTAGVAFAVFLLGHCLLLSLPFVRLLASSQVIHLRAGFRAVSLTSCLR